MSPPTFKAVAAVFIRKVKRSGGTGLWGSYVVEEDHHGLWLYTPGGSLFRGTTPSGEIVICHTGWPDPPGAPVIHLIPRTGWWFARWQEVPAPLGAHLAIDVCTPAELHAGVWSYDDLELDFIKSRSGDWELVDQDEFDHEFTLGRISSSERDASLRAVSELLARLDGSDRVFDSLGWDRLERCAETEYPPLVELP